MDFLRNTISKKNEPIRSYEDFWKWFQKNERLFYEVVNSEGDIEKEFFDKLYPKLNELKQGFFFMTGMYDDSTAELVITADGLIKNIAFIEELVKAAPKIDGWKFTALKPAMDVENVSIRMWGYNFSTENMSFYSNDDADYPDEIAITIVHNDYTEENKTEIKNGVYIFLDNYLGELDFAVGIDVLTVTGRSQVEKELIPIEKLKDYVKWREKEFIEKYEGERHSPEDDKYTILTAELESGNEAIAVINTDLLKWDRKASHPWILTIEMPYDGSKKNGMPDDETFQRLNEFEDDLFKELSTTENCLNIGRQTAMGIRKIFFACKDFREPSKVLYQFQNENAGNFEISYDIYKEKYWQSFNHFKPAY